MLFPPHPPLPTQIVSLSFSPPLSSLIFSFFSLTSSERQQNAQAFSWPSRLVPVLEEHRIIIRTSREKAEESLRTRREKFVDELGAMKKQVAELKDLGDVGEVPRYLKRAQALQAKMDSALDRIDEFNKEEEAFEWEQTTYPLRHKLVQELEPFLNLYKAIDAFRTQHAQWMDGPFTEINPEAVEAESGNIWRLLYKLEKGFNELPAPRGMAATVKAELDEFKENVPLIQVWVWRRVWGVEESVSFIYLFIFSFFFLKDFSHAFFFCFFNK